MRLEPRHPSPQLLPLLGARVVGVSETGVNTDHNFFSTLSRGLAEYPYFDILQSEEIDR